MPIPSNTVVAQPVAGRSPVRRWRAARLAGTVLAAAVLLSSGCAFIAEQLAAPKQAGRTRSPQALEADQAFWTALHGGRYEAIEPTIRQLQIAYLAAPTDAVTAAHIGFMRAWQGGEAARLPAPDPATTDHIALARRYFAEAHALQPDEARFHGFLAAMTMAEAAIHADERMSRRGYYLMRDAIAAWPEFNLFTGGYVLSRLGPASERFREGLAWQWETLDRCFGEPIDRQAPELAKYFVLDTKVGPKRVCWNSWIAPHNVEGFFLNMGDMLVKSGQWQTGQRIYAAAKLSGDYARWPYRDVLERRIAHAERNVARFAAAEPDADRIDGRILIHTPLACTGCHQRAAAP